MKERALYLSLVLFFLVSFAHLNAQTLQACYTLDSNTLDYTPNAFHGVNYGASSTVGHDGNATGAYLFNGADSYIDITYNSFFLDTAYSYCVWVKPTRNPVSGQSNIILSIGSVGSDQTICYSNVNGNCVFSAFTYCGYGEQTWFFSPFTPQFNTWYFLCAVRTKNTFSFYIDGVLVGTKFTHTDRIAWGEGPLQARIGKRSHEPQNSMNFAGAIDEVRIYDYGIDEKKVKEIYSTVGCDCKVALNHDNSEKINNDFCLSNALIATSWLRSPFE